MHQIELKPSRLLGLLLAGMLALALIAVQLAALPGAVRWTLGIAAAGLSGWGWWRARGLETLRIDRDGQLQCRDREGAWREVEVLGDSLVSAVLIVLRYRTTAGQVRSLVLLPDSADSDALRRLRVTLRWAPRRRSDTAFPDAG